MKPTVGDHIVERLKSWGVRTIFGYPGDGINGILTALDRAKNAIRFIQVRHEESAAFMACAHAKFTGEVGVCLATSGPGAIHLLNGLYDAQMDHQPVVAIVGQSARTAIGADYQQEVDLVSLFKDVAHDYVHQCMVPAQARHLIDRAMRIAFAERTVTCVIVPNDVQEEDAVETPPHEHNTTLTGIGFHRGVLVPSDYDLNAAADILNAGEQVGDPRRRGRARRRSRRCSRSPTGSALASRRRCSARRSCPTTCRSSPARWACSAARRATR